MSSDPRETIVRDVLLYPANGDEPHITSMIFSEAGAKHDHGLYTRAADLRPFYGSQMDSTRIQMLGIENQSDKRVESEYIAYYNLSPELPVNVSLARVVDANPNRPGSKPMWRGNVVVVKTEEWPGPVVMGGGAHMNYVDVKLSVRPLFEQCFKKWYNTPEEEQMGE